MQRRDRKVCLDLHLAFGSNFSLPTKIQLGLFEEDQKLKLVYLVGKALVKRTLDTGALEFIRLSDNIQSIECMSISPSRNHVAICQKLKNQNFLLLNVYGLRSRDAQIKHFKLPQAQKQATFRCIAFSPSQPKYACCMTGSPDYQLMFLDISRSRGLAVSGFSVQGAQQVAICPSQSHVVSCAGKNIFRLYKVEDYAFKPFEEIKKLPKNRNFVAHAWFDKMKILLGTDKGELFLIGAVGNNFQVKKHFGNVLEPEPTHGDLVPAVTAICVFSKGFILGSNRGQFALWIKKEEDEENFEDEYTGDLVRRWKAPAGKTAEVVCIRLCPKEEKVVVAFRNNALATTSMEQLLGKQQDTAQERAFVRQDLMEYLYDGFHVAPITCIDVCLHRPIVATLSKKQNTIRLWNYKKAACELVKKFDAKLDQIEESPQLLNCMALHPMGYYMAVGCCDKLRLYHILSTELRNYREIVLKGVCQLRFSNGGHLLAVAYPRQKHNIHLINIYNSYTLQEVGRLSDHSNVILQLYWRHDDRVLFSTGADGSLAEWHAQDPRGASKEWVSRKWTINNTRYTSLIYERTNKSLLACGLENKKPILRQFRIEKDQVQKVYSLGFRVTRLCWLTSLWNTPAIIGGTQEGCLKVFNSPFDSIVEQSVNVHLLEVTGLAVSPCGRFVFSAGKDGILFVHQVTMASREGLINPRLHDQLAEQDLNPLIACTDDELADIVLVQRTDMSEKLRYVRMLEKTLEELNYSLETLEQEEGKIRDGQLRVLQAEKQKVLDQLTEETEKIKQQKKELELTTHTNYADLQSKNAHMYEELEALYEKKLSIENKKYYGLERKCKQEAADQQQQAQKLLKACQDNIELLKKQFKSTFQRAEKVHQAQHTRIISNENEFSERLAQMEDQHQAQLKKLSETILELEAHKNQKSAEYVTSIESVRRQIRILNEEIVRYMSANEQLKQNLKELSQQLEGIETKIESKKQHLASKEENLLQREERIGVYQERISDLEKKKKVLSYRTWEMRQQIEPKQDEIDFLKEGIYELEKQFEALLEGRRSMKQLQEKLKRDQQQLNKQLALQKTQTRQKANSCKEICAQIGRIVQDRQSADKDKKSYEQHMRRLWEKYQSLLSSSSHINQSPQGTEEMTRRHEHLENEIAQVHRTNDSKLKEKDQQIYRATQQNSKLISQLIVLRQQNTRLNKEAHNGQKNIETVSRQIVQMKNLINNGTAQDALRKKLGGTGIVTSQQGINSSFSSSQASQLPQTNSKVPSRSPPLMTQSTQKPLPPATHSNNNTMSRSSSQPIIRGRVVRGLNYDLNSLNSITRSKLRDLQLRLEAAKTSLNQSQSELNQAVGRVKEHLESGCLDTQLVKKVNDCEM